MYMSKETYYFPHDYNARNDDKLQVFMIDAGAEGYGIYWALVEILHEEETHTIELTPIFLKSFAKQMSTPVESVEKCIQAAIQSELYIKSGNFISSNRVDKNMEIRAELSQKRSKAGKASALKRSTSVEQLLTVVEQVATKERKGKEKKGNIYISDLLVQVEDFKKLNPGKYTEVMYQEFIRYWNEPTISNSNKKRWQLNKTWDVSGRLATWFKNQKSNNGTTGHVEYTPKQPPLIVG